MDEYLKKAEFWAKILGHMPGVAAIFLSGSLATGASDQCSDIDFFIITSPGKIWTARFWVFVVLKISKQLAKPHNHLGKICPNHFITSDNLEIEEQDPYSANLFSHNKPLYDPQNIFRDFALTNTWVSQFGESFPMQIVTSDKETHKAPLLASPQRRGIAETFLRWIQLKKIKNNPEFKNKEAKIVFSDTELRFHPVPKNQHWKKPQKKIDNLEIHNPYS